MLIKNKTEEVINMSASGKLLDKKSDIDSESISVTPEFERINTDQRIDTFSKVKELQAEGVSINRISKALGIGSAKYEGLHDKRHNR